MKHIQESKLYIDDIKEILKNNIPFNKLFGSKILISGSTGLVGTLLVDVLMFLNRNYNANITVFALCRNYLRAKDVFNVYKNDTLLSIIAHDINLPIESLPISDTVDYVIHMASNTHPLDYSHDPIGTITSNVIGTKKIPFYIFE